MDIPKTAEQHTHGQFPDDTHVIIEAKKSYVEATLDLFRKFGDASDLYIKEVGVKAVLVSNEPLPHELEYLQWTWETKGSLSKLLGIFMGVEISPSSMASYL